MANRFLNNITINDEYTLPSADGTADQIITTDGAGQLSFVDQSTVVSGASRTVSILVKNISSADGGVNLSKGDPVYIYGSVGASERLYVDLADAGDSSKMPCVALLDQDLSPNGEGTATVTGKLKNLITSPIDGATPAENDTIYVKSGGGLTLTKPTGVANLIQNVGQVGRVSTSSDGNIVVSAILRSNDVPNLTTGKIWVGSTGNTIESATVHLDEANGRMGIGTDSPGSLLHIKGADPILTIQDTSTGTLDASSTLRLGESGAGGVLDVYWDIKQASDNLNTHLEINHSSNGNHFTILDGGNVGIGTTNPTTKLEINGPNHDANFTSGCLMIQQQPQGDRMFIDGNDIDCADGILFLNDYSLNPVRLGGDLQMPNGDIGVGFTTAPTERLHVDGNVRVTGAYYDSNNEPGTSGQVLSSTATGTDWVSVSELPTDTRYVLVAGDTMTGTLTMSNAQIQINDSGAQARLNLNNTGTGDPQINFQLVGSSKFTIGVDNSDSDKFKISAGSTVGSSDRIVVDSSGNVGIGTTSPSEKLEVAGNIILDSSNANLKIKAGTTGTKGDIQWTFSTDSTVYASAGITYDNRSTDGFLIDSGYPITLDYASSYIRFSNNGSEKMRINTSGNVGIGTTSPTAKLHVGGSTDQTAVLKIEAGNNAGFPAATTELRMIGYGSRGQGVFFEDTSNSGEEWFAGLNYASSWNKYSIGYDASGGQAEYVANAILTVVGDTGRVGVGTPNPSSELHVSGAIQNDQFTIPNTAGTSGQVLKWPASGTTLEWGDAGGGGGASSLNDLSDVLVDTASLYVGTVPSSLLLNPQNNTTLGITAGSSLTSGVNNTIIGSNAANASTNGVDNVIIGYNAAYNDLTINDSVYIGSEVGGADTSLGDQTVAIGYRVGYTTGTNASQVLIGDQVSYSDYAGTGAVAIGKESMYSGPRGNYDVAIGFRSSYNGTRSYSNSVHIGGFAGYFGYGDYNVSVGYQSFYSNTNKNGTVCIGHQAGRSGMYDYNIVIGYQSSYNGVLGTNNTVIGGYRAGYSSTLRPGSNCVLLGSNTTASSSGANNEITLGDSSIATLRCQVTSITSLSDRRDKKDIEDLPYGLEFINSLKPKKFIWDNRAEVDGDGKEFFSDKKGSKDIGFIAQDLQEVDNEWTQLVYESNPDKLEASYGRLVPVLVQAIKELKAEIELLKNK